ncbi:MAG: nucleotidyltransferase domain-containing protein [Bacteroidetes bacterium]|nr:nucleotidyltransferase domain-containing protein [Bacteroidota bacterium]
MLLEKKHKEKIIAEYLFAKDEVLFAYIFGSFVDKDNYHDIDIAVYLKDDFDKNDFKKFPYGYESGAIADLNLLVRSDVDFVVMNCAEILIQKRIIDRGIRIFSKVERKRISYENYIRKLYIDSAHLRNIRRHYLPGKIKNA